MSTERKARLVRGVSDALRRIGLPADALVVVAVSGGADSVALLHVMHLLREEFGYRLIAAHLNHRLRGAESDRDEAFVRKLCRSLGVELEVGRAEGLEAGMSNLEERAREQRYSFLRNVTRRRDASWVALAHQAEDQAETVMLRLLRGAGAGGLAAMNERGPEGFIRPMLGVSRADILEYLNEAGQDFVSDSTNDSLKPLRNRVRRQLLPALERDYASGFSRRLRELSYEMRELDDFVRAAARDEMARRSGEGGTLDLAGFERLHPALQAALIRMFIEERIGSLRTIGRRHAEAVRRLCLHGPVNGTLDLPRGIRMEREYEKLMLRGTRRNDRSSGFRVVLGSTGTTVISEAGFVFEASHVEQCAVELPASKWEALFDAGEIGDGLMVRNFLPGDRIQPIGMRGHRKVKDIFIDGRIPRAERKSFPVVECGGEIVWLPGLARSGKATVGETTKSALRVTTQRLAGLWHEALNGVAYH